VFERKWLSLWFLTSSSEVLTQVVGITVTVSLIAWSITWGVQSFDQDVSEALVDSMDAIGHLVETGEVEAENWSTEKASAFTQEFADQIHEESDAFRGKALYVLSGVTNVALVPAFLSAFVLELVHHIILAAWNRRWRIMIHIALEGLVSAAVGFLVRKPAGRIGLGFAGVTIVCYTVLKLVVEALLADYIYGFVWDRRVCPYCEAEVSESDRFCSTCGYRLSRRDDAVEAEGISALE
jgi:hypothetical protein